jgi:hypothetical protein
MGGTVGRRTIIIGRKQPPEPPKSPPLPATGDWVANVDLEGHQYFVNSKTGNAVNEKSTTIFFALCD